MVTAKIDLRPRCRSPTLSCFRSSPSPAPCSLSTVAVLPDAENGAGPAAALPVRRRARLQVFFGSTALAAALEPWRRGKGLATRAAYPESLQALHVLHRRR